MNTVLADSPPPAFHHLIGRSLALALGLFCLLNAIGTAWLRDFDATLWLLDLRWLPHGAALALVGLLGLALGFLGLGGKSLWPQMAFFASVVAGLAAAVALANAIGCWRIWAKGGSHSFFPVPFSLAVAAGLAGAALGCGPVVGDAWVRGFKLSLGAGLAGLAAILLQVTLFGLTDYRTTADVAVVYGARAFPDGHCSDALADRVEAGAALYRQGLVPRLLMSGGPVAGAAPGDAAPNEPEAMKRLAMRLGVPESAILLDPLGVSTAATAQNTAALAKEHHWRRILIVSHFYHLSRSKLTMQRAGVGRMAQVRSVPASMRGRVLVRLPYYMLREIGAFAKDWLAPRRAQGPAA